MRRISDTVKAQLNEEPDVCARKSDGGCSKVLTWEHAIIYAGSQLDAAWAIVKLCERHHGVNQYLDGGDLNKEKNIWLALLRATDDELIAISKAEDYIALRERLNKKYERS